MECVRILGLNSSCANALEFMQKDRDFKPVFSDFPWVVVHIFYGILWAHSDYLFCSSCRTGAPGRHVYIHELWPYLHFNHICLDQRWPFDPKRVNHIISCGRLLLFLIHYPFCIYVLCLWLCSSSHWKLSVFLLLINVGLRYVTCPWNVMGQKLNIGFQCACKVGLVLLHSLPFHEKNMPQICDGERNILRYMLEIGPLRSWLRLNEVRRVKSWSDRTGDFIKR